MQIDWKWFLIGVVLGLLLGCQPMTDYQNYNIFTGYETKVEQKDVK